MSQNSLTLPTTGTVSGLQMTQYANNALDTLNTLASGASAPSSPEAGQIWHDTTNNLLKIRSLDNTTWIPYVQLNESAYVAAPSNNPSATNDRLNRLINGAMMIDQVNEGASYSISTSNAQQYTLDQWIVTCQSAGASGVTAQQVSDAPAGFQNSLKVTVGTGAAVGAAEWLLINQKIEGVNIGDLSFGNASAVPISLSFWVKSSQTGTFSFSLMPSGEGVAYVGTFSIASAGTWTKISVPNIPGPQSGTWLTGASCGLQLFITPAVGTSYQTSSLNSWITGPVFGANTQTNTVLSTSGATFQLAGVQLNSGVFCQPFDKHEVSQELLYCERYYQKSFPQGTAVAQNTGYSGAFGLIVTASAFGVSMRLRTPMRASPTLATYNPLNTNANWRDTSGSDLTSNAFIIGGDSIALYGTGGTAGHEARIHFTCSARM